jgi:aminoglycoside 2'-N-acetyltransferase I
VLEMRVLATGDVPQVLLAELRLLVDAAFGGDFSDDDWAHGLGGRHVVLTEGHRPVAHASVVPRVLEVAGRPIRAGYVEAVATAPDRQGTGLGTRAMETITRLVREEYQMGALSTSAPGFYAPLGWERWQGPTYARDGGRVVRTADEDDGIMVLRFGASAAVDLTASISCEARPGDDW